MNRPGSGCTERDGEEVWNANCQVIQAALQQSSLHAREIRAVSMCGYGGGMILLGAQGDPVCPFIVSTDSRADGLLTEFRKTAPTTRSMPIPCSASGRDSRACCFPGFSETGPIS